MKDEIRSALSIINRDGHRKEPLCTEAEGTDLFLKRVLDEHQLNRDLFVQLMRDRENASAMEYVGKHR